MGRPRKSMAELKLSGTFQQNPGRYKKVTAAQYASGSIGRVPRYFTTHEKAAWKEIVSTSPGLGEADRLTVEVAAKILAKVKTGTAGSVETSRLLATLDKLRNRSAASAVPPVSGDTAEEDEMDRYIREEAEDEADDLLDQQEIEAEIERRRNEPMPEGLSEPEKKYYFRHHEVGLALGVLVKCYDNAGRFSGTSTRRYQLRLKERS